MAKDLGSSTVNAPGFYGLNTQDSSVGLQDGFAIIANNAVIDKSGRIGSRKGWTIANTSGASISTKKVKALHQHFDSSGNSYTLVCANNKLYKLSDAGALSELTYGGGGTAPTITDDHWKIVSLNGIAYFFQEGHNPLYFDPATSTTTYKRVTEHASYAATVPEANAAIAAYGRIWAGRTATNKTTLYWSDLLLGYDWTVSPAGSIDLSSVFTNGVDEIVAIEAIGGLLVIFCTKCIILYEGPTDPDPTSSFKLREVIKNVGCVARDSVQNTGNDIFFLSQSGIQALSRLQTNDTALPMKDISRNVRDDVLNYVSGTTDKDSIKAVYHPIEAFYVLSFPDIGKSFVFDTRAFLENGAARATTWSLAPTAFLSKTDNSLLLGLTGYVGTYSSYSDNTSAIRFQYYTNYRDLELPTILKILKRISFTLLGAASQAVVIKWGFDYSSSYSNLIDTLDATGNIAYYNISEYNTTSEYTTGLVIDRVSIPATGSGLVLQMGIEAEVEDAQLSVQALNIYVKQGKTV
jgi:hypothetical protein